MKKNLLTALAVLAVVVAAYAQNIGVTAGYLNMEGKIKGDGMSIGVDDSGFYLGAFTSIKLNETFDFQPGIEYASVGSDSFLLIPLLFKYSVVEKFNLSAGGQFDYILEDVEDMKKVGIGFSFGLGYDITKKMAVNVDYSLGLNDRLKGELEGEGVSVKFNTFKAGLAYKF